MKTLTATAAALILSGSAMAGGFNSDNPDAYGSVLADLGKSHTSMSTAVEPGIGDQYGSVLLTKERANMNSAKGSGNTDSYNSVIFDVNEGISW